METLNDLIQAAAEIPPDRGFRFVSSQFRETWISYAELHRRVLFHADHLLRQDVSPGDRVVVPLTTDPDVVCSFLALIWIGAIPVSVSGQLAGQERTAYLRRIVAMVERFGLDRLLTDRTMAEHLTGDLTLDPRLLVDPSPPRFDPDHPALPVPPATLRTEDVCFIQFSSGSTGDPKGVQITHGNLATNLRIIVENDGRTADSSFISWLPLYHDMGLVGGFLSSWVYHNPVVLMHPVCFLMKPVAWLDYISRHRCTISPVPNFAIDMCNTRIRDTQLAARQPDLGSLDYIYNGSEPVNADAIERFYDRFAPFGARRGTIHPAYGMAEATLMITAHPHGEALVTRDVDGVRVVSVGFPRGDFRIRIEGENGEERGANEVGEILVRGESISPGYFQSPEENRRRFRDGWFRTGDLGLRDAEGRLFITGRIKDLIIVGGRNFYAHDIAAKLEELPFVRRGKSHVFGYNVEGREEVIVMTVLDSSMSNAVRTRMEELKEFLSTQQGKWLLGQLGSRTEEFIRDMNPSDLELLKTAVKQYLLREFGLPIHDVFLVPRLPRTTSGKIRRSECETLYREYLESGTPPEE